jgi:putative FmdB family regulatory protein
VPTYQYACTACGHELEAVQSFTDDPLTQCPACEGRLRKLFGSVGVVFKGPGFYRTDSRAGANGARAGKDSAGNGSAEGSAGKDSAGNGSAEGSAGKDSAEKGSAGKGSAGEAKSAGTSEKATAGATSNA